MGLWGRGGGARTRDGALPELFLSLFFPHPGWPPKIIERGTEKLKTVFGEN